MLSTILNSFKVPEIRRKLLFTASAMMAWSERYFSQAIRTPSAAMTSMKLRAT